MMAGASYSLKPLSWLEGFALGEALQTSIKYAAFFRYADGPVSVSLPNPASENNYIGSEVDLGIAFRPFSDLGVSLAGGIFLPNAAAGGPFDAQGATGVVTKWELSASFSF